MLPEIRSGGGGNGGENSRFYPACSEPLHCRCPIVKQIMSPYVHCLGGLSHACRLRRVCWLGKRGGRGPGKGATNRLGCGGEPPLHQGVGVFGVFSIVVEVVGRHLTLIACHILVESACLKDGDSDVGILRKSGSYRKTCIATTHNNVVEGLQGTFVWRSPHSLSRVAG